MRAASASPSAAVARSKKYCLKMLGSSVLPDLLETMNSVRFRSTELSMRADLRRVGRVEHVQPREARPAAEASAPAPRGRGSIRPCRAAARRVKPGALDLGGKGLQMRRPPSAARRRSSSQPSHWLLVGLGPQRGVPRPQAPDLALACARSSSAASTACVESLRQLAAHRVELAAEDACGASSAPRA